MLLFYLKIIDAVELQRICGLSLLRSALHGQIWLFFVIGLGFRLTYLPDSGFSATFSNLFRHNTAFLALLTRLNLNVNHYL